MRRAKIIILIIVMLMISFKAHAYSPWSGNLDTDSVPPDKVWKIVFSKDILPASVNARNIFVAEKPDDDKVIIVDEGKTKPIGELVIVPTELEFDGRRTVRIKPVNAYSMGKEYVLYIKDVYATDAEEKLKTPVSMNFRISNQGYTDENFFEFDVLTHTITGYSDNGPKTVSIPPVIRGEKVERIGSYAFKHKSITEVQIPDSVEDIGVEAFYGNELRSLKIGRRVRYIGASAFEKNMIKRLTVPDSVENIGNQAFCDNGTEELRLGNSIKTIGQGAFQNHKLKRLRIPDSVQLIDDFAFKSNRETIIVKDKESDVVVNSDAIMELVLGKSVKTIGKEAFANQNISVLAIPYETTIIDTGAFKNNLLSVLDIPKSAKLEKIGDYAFSDNLISRLILGDNIKSIGYMAFFNNKLREVELPQSLEEFATRMGDSYAFANNLIEKLQINPALKVIPGYTFQNNNLYRVEMPEGLEEIGYGAFQNNRLQTLLLSKSLKRIDSDAFVDNPKLLGVGVYKDTEYQSTAFDELCNVETTDNPGIYSYVVPFGDENLANEILGYFNNYHGDILSDMQGGEYDFKLLDGGYKKDPNHRELTNLDMEMLESFAYRAWSEYNEYMDISSIKGLEYAVNMKTLSLSSSDTEQPFAKDGIRDISPLKDLLKLELLRLSHNNISDISVLKELPLLSKVYLSHNRIDNIDVLSNMEQLTDLDLALNPVNDLEAIKGLHNLRMLGITKTGVSDIGKIEGLKELRELYANDLGLKDISVLGGLYNLETIFLRDNRLSDFTPLENLRLQYLDVGNQRIRLITMDGETEEEIVSQVEKGARTIRIDNPFKGLEFITNEPFEVATDREDVSVQYIPESDELEFTFEFIPDKTDPAAPPEEIASKDLYLNLKITYTNKYEFYGNFEIENLFVEKIHFTFQ